MSREKNNKAVLIEVIHGGLVKVDLDMSFLITIKASRVD